MNLRALKLPPTIQYALKRLETFVNNPHKFGFITYNRPGKPRLMRSERRENIQKVLMALVRHMDLVSGRIIRPLGPDRDVDLYADCSLSWLVKVTGVSRRTLCRIIVDLESVGWLQRDDQIIRRGPDPDTLAVATVIRRLTQRFFEALGLVKDFLRDREHLQAKRRAREMKTLFRIVCARAKAAVKQLNLPVQHPPRMEQAELSSFMTSSLQVAHEAWRERLKPKPPQNS